MRLKYLMQQKSIANLCIQAVNDKVECFMVMAINGNIPYISIHPPLYCLTVPDSRIHFKLAARFQESPPDSHPLTHTHTLPQTHTYTHTHIKKAAIISSTSTAVPSKESSSSCSFNCELPHGTLVPGLEESLKVSGLRWRFVAVWLPTNLANKMTLKEIAGEKGRINT